MPKKKSYNPFKMWGSYVGAIVILLLYFGGLYGYENVRNEGELFKDNCGLMYDCINHNNPQFETRQECWTKCQIEMEEKFDGTKNFYIGITSTVMYIPKLIFDPGNRGGDSLMGAILLGIPLMVIVGFLIGWGIHSLVRKLKKH